MLYKPTNVKQMNLCHLFNIFTYVYIFKRKKTFQNRLFSKPNIDLSLQFDEKMTKLKDKSVVKLFCNVNIKSDDND